MIKHIVMWDVRGESDEEKRAAAFDLKAKFESLRGEIPGLLFLEIGIDFSRVDYACDVVLYSEFKDEASLANYATHPAHLRVRDSLKDVRIARHQVDYSPLKNAAAQASAG
jgi:hypothetical protein